MAAKNKNTTKKSSTRTSQSSPNPKKFTRSSDDRMIAGVCGGLGEYFAIDPIIFRLIFLVLLFSGVGLIPYILIWIVVPTAK